MVQVMFSTLSGLLRSRKLFPRVILGAIGAVAAIAISRVVEVRAEEMSSDQITAMIQSVSPELADVLSQDFATEYAALKSAMAMEIAVGGDVKAATTQALLDLKAQSAGYIAQADDSALAAFANSMIALYSSVTDLDGPLMCADYVTNGAGAMAGTDFAARHAQAAMSNLATLLRTASTGRDHPVERRPATDAEWADVATQSLALGATSEGFDALAQGTVHPDLCPSIVAFLKAAQGNDGAQLVRAEVLTLFAKGE